MPTLAKLNIPVWRGQTLPCSLAVPTSLDSVERWLLRGLSTLNDDASSALLEFSTDSEITRISGQLSWTFGHALTASWTVGTIYLGLMYWDDAGATRVPWAEGTIDVRAFAAY